MLCCSLLEASGKTQESLVDALVVDVLVQEMVQELILGAPL